MIETASVGSKRGNTDARPHLASLDGMRGILAVCVMLYHYGLRTVLGSIFGGWIGGDWGLCVDFFFMLSGFVLCRVFASALPTLSGYWISRTFRLGPLIILSTAAILLLEGWKSYDTATLLANITMTQSLLGLRSINFPAWSVPFELFLPCLLLVAFGELRKLPAPVLAVGLSVALALSACGAWMLTSKVDYPWLRSSSNILAGGLLFLLSDRTSVRRQMWLGTICFVTALVVVSFSERFSVVAIVFPVLAAGAIWQGAGSRGVLAAQPLRLLGSWSYAIYLVHAPVLLKFFEKSMTPEFVNGNVVLKIAMIAVTMSIAAGLHTLVERPMMSIGKSLARRRLGAPVVT